MSEHEKYPFHESFLKKEWSYATGAVMLALLASALVIVTGTAWGVTGAFPMWGGKVLEAIGLNPDSWNLFNGSLGKFKWAAHQATLTNLGIIVGALISALLAAQFKVKKIKHGKQIIAALSGGLLMGVGARLSLGCNIGALFSGLPAFSLHGWLFFIAIFAGATCGGILLKKYFL